MSTQHLIYILIGPPACGKSTQLNLLSQALDIPGISTGQEFRRLARRDPDLADRLAHGILASPAQLSNLLTSIAAAHPNQSLILDGSIRAPEHIAIHLEHWPARQLRVIEFTLDYKHIVQREASRRREMQRSDDKNDVLDERLALYNVNRDLIDRELAAQRISVTAVDASGSVDSIHAAVMKGIEQIV